METKEKVQEWSLIRHPHYGGAVSILHEECREPQHSGTVANIACNVCGKPIPNHLLLQRNILNGD